MSADLDRLMGRVLSDPDADAPRLAFATACERSDPEHAELIRNQIAYRDYLRANRDDFFPGAQRAFSLVRKNGEKWAGNIVGKVSWYGFFRGFVEKVALDAADFLAKADDLYQAAPIRRLSLKNVAVVADELFGSPHLRRIVSLSLEDERIGDRGAELIATSPHLGRLAWLNLAGTDITSTGLASLIQSDQLGALSCVDLHRTPVFGTDIDDEHSDDQGQILIVSDGLWPIEKKYRRRTWLHTVTDLGFRYLDERTW